jgi:asparagine synthase (glutamine-hydrolysing)
MCGIAGLLSVGVNDDPMIINRMLDSIRHRGPDDGGTEMLETPAGRLHLGHRRLSILDLSSGGHQPMKHNGLTITYNGEVYNFAEIRVELEQLGYQFHSGTDTEVILKAWDRWGEKALERFNGMFAFALHDAREQVVYLVRDRLGVKPLYWYCKDGRLIFASELKALISSGLIKKEIDRSALAQYFSYGYVPAPRSIVAGVSKLEAGTVLRYCLKTGGVRSHRYWSAQEVMARPKLSLGLDEAEEALKELCTSAFKYRMVSDVPVGVFLSGGYDSSLVTAMLQKDMGQRLKTFTIGFENPNLDEAPHARAIANFLGTDHYEQVCTDREALSILPELPNIFDEPFGDSSAIPTLLVSRLARREVTVSLSADGGDEIFGGYNSYTRALNHYRKLQSAPLFTRQIIARAINSSLFTLNHLSPKSAYRASHKAAKLAEMLQTRDLMAVFDVNARYFQPLEVRWLLGEDPFIFGGQGDSINDLMRRDIDTWLPDDILTKVDRTTMHVSLEGREPFLDYRLVEFGMQLPDEFKVYQGEKKRLLRQLTHSYLPPELMDRPKRGFAADVSRLVTLGCLDQIESLLSDGFIGQDDILSENRVRALIHDFKTRQMNPHKLWLVAVFGMWYKAFQGN